MPTIITNQAQLQFTYGSTTATAASNVASTILQGSLTATKNVLESVYRADSNLTYIVNLVNRSAAAMAPVSIVDNLGAYDVTNALSVMPLSYTGPSQLYLDGAFYTNLTPDIFADHITFNIPSIAAGANVMLIYKAVMNEYAPLETGSSVTNVITVHTPELLEPLTGSSVIPVDDYADVTITKAMSPNPVTDGSRLTYRFILQNFGNTEATNVVLNDIFSPAPSAIVVSVDGKTLSASDYSYVGDVLTVPGAAAADNLVIPAANFVRDGVTGEITVHSSSVSITVIGTL